MNKKAHHVPTVPRKLLEILGKSLTIARKERGWRQLDLALRLGVTRQTISAMEHGDAKVAAGFYFTAAWMLNIPLITGTASESRDVQSTLNTLFSLLESQQPKRIQALQDKPINDDF